MSVPRRKPLSTSTATRPPTAATISGSASMVERPLSSLRAPWLETMMPSMPALTASVAFLVREDALDEDLHPRGVAQRFEEVPAHAGGQRVGQAGEVYALVHGAALLVGREVAAVVADGAVALVGERHAPLVSWLRPPRRSTVTATTGQPARSRARRRRGDIPLVGGVELVPDRRAARFRDLLDAAGGGRREDLQVVAGPRAARDGDLALAWKAFWPPIGASRIGVSWRTPRISQLMSILLTSTRRRGRSWKRPCPRVARSVASSSTPEAM